MPIQKASTRAERLKKAFASLRSTNRWPPTFESYSDYPVYVYAIRDRNPEDDNVRDLVRQLTAHSWSEGDSKADRDETLVRPIGKHDRLARGVIVYRSPVRPENGFNAERGHARASHRSLVVQIVPRQTSHVTSVLGRVGVMEIICDHIQHSLAAIGEIDKEEKGSDKTTGSRNEETWTIAIADLARIIDDGDVDNLAKYLTRLNRGEYVLEHKVKLIANAFGMPTQDLVFDNPGIYKASGRKEHMTNSASRTRGISARSRRQLMVSIEGDKEQAKKARELRNFQPNLFALLPSSATYIKDLALTIYKQDRIAFPQCASNAPVSSPEHFQHMSSVRSTLAKLAGAPESIEEKIVRVIDAINKADFQLWFGEYDDRVELEDRWFALSERVVVLALSRTGHGPPCITVDLSHTLGLGPDPEF